MIVSEKVTRTSDCVDELKVYGIRLSCVRSSNVPE